MIHKRFRMLGGAMAILGGLAGPALGAPAYIPLGDTNQIARVNATGTTVEALFSGVESAHGLAITPDGKRLYVGSLLEKPATAASPSEKPAGVTDAEHAAHHGGAAPTAAASPRMLSFITRMDAATGTVQRRIDVNRFTHHVTVTPDGRFVIGVQPAAAQIVVIDAATDKVLRFVPVGSAPNYAAVTRDNSWVFVSAAGDNRITVLDGKTWRKVGSVQVGTAPEHMAFSPDEEILYVVNVGSNELSLVDTTSLKEVRRVPTGVEPHGVAVNAQSKTVVVANKASDTLSVFDPVGQLVQTVPLAPQPYHAANSPDGGQIWITSRAEGILWRLSPETLSVLGTLSLPGVGHQVASVR